MMLWLRAPIEVTAAEVEALIRTKTIPRGYRSKRNNTHHNSNRVTFLYVRPLRLKGP